LIDQSHNRGEKNEGDEASECGESFLHGGIIAGPVTLVPLWLMKSL